MITLHPTVKAYRGGYVPMINIRGAKGQMIGSKTPQGEARETSKHTCRIACEIDARCIALRLAAKHPALMRVAH